MKFLFLGGLAVFGYLLSATLQFTAFRNTENNNKLRLFAAGSGWLAAAFHLLYNTKLFLAPEGINFSFFGTASLIALILTLMLLTASITKPLEKLGIAIFPMVAALLLLDLTIPLKPHYLSHISWQMNGHILVSIIAFSLFNIAAFQAILLALQDWQLRNHQPIRFMQSLPSLQTMEFLLFQIIGVGLFFLTLSLLSGILFVNDLFAQHLAHKTVLSITAWIIFGTLLLGRLRYGWRGRTAIKWTLSGFALLLLAYFGSKLVLELILQKY
ncbi:MAG: cytochrome c biogenesis protein CcsA [Methylococcaceae bacterium]